MRFPVRRRALRPQLSRKFCRFWFMKFCKVVEIVYYFEYVLQSFERVFEVTDSEFLGFMFVRLIVFPKSADKTEIFMKIQMFFILFKKMMISRFPRSLVPNFSFLCSSEL